jgi:hypothetical protein
MCCVRLSFPLGGRSTIYEHSKYEHQLTKSSKDQDCDYTPPINSGVLGPEPLVQRHKMCGHADLSPHGATELLQAVKACIEAPLHSEPTTDLLYLVSEILELVGFDLANALTAFGPCIQQWCPIIVEDHILGSCDYVVSEPVNPQDGPKNPVLWMSLWLVLRKPCSPHEHMGTSELYAALKQIHALSQSAVKLGLDGLQIGLMIAVYEVGHGLRQQAFQTLSSCTATMRLLELEAQRKQDIASLEMMKWLKTSVAMLDRYDSSFS